MMVVVVLVMVASRSVGTRLTNPSDGGAVTANRVGHEIRAHMCTTKYTVSPCTDVYIFTYHIEWWLRGLRINHGHS